MRRASSITMNQLSQNRHWQPEATSVSDRLWDVVIIGAGPAGATAACHLAARHHRILLLDRKKFPREKVCGDGLLTDALRCLDAIGVGENVRQTGHPIATCTLSSPSRKEVEIPGEYLTIKRSLLDMIVAQKAVESGTRFAAGEVNRMAVEPDGRVSFSITGSHQPFRARIGILATGADIRLLRQMNWPARKRPSAVALRCYVRSTYALDRLVVAYDRSTVPGYAWIFPLSNHDYNIGCGIRLRDDQKTRIDLKKTFNNFVDAFPLAREVIRHSDQRTDLQAAALRCDFEGAYPFVDGPIVALGETIGTTLPFIGEGIGKAMESGQMAAGAISAALNSNDLGKLVQYNQYIESELKPRYHGYRMAEKWLTNPWINDFILERFSKSRYASETLAGVIAETNDPRDIFSLKGIIKTLWK